jgi:hypothetical protein
MRARDLIREQAYTPAHLALNAIINQVGHDYDGYWSFRYSDIQQNNLVKEFKQAFMAGLIRFKAPVDWYEPTNPQKV